ncbi:MAG TPA: rhodanese-like domain-containing protein [Candidatus Binatia bacterium]|jgi:rhodanese-related sulfurtransferase|nr:rhodanese-like domain-containing protein [Candidatus Binatia bacterium]
MKHAPGFVRLVDAARARVREITIADLQRMRAAGDAFVLLDVREQDEWRRGHIPGALHLGKGIIERDIEGVVPDPATQLVLYCGGGYRSALAADTLQQMGYANVLSMDGGWRAWTEAGLPIEP